MGSVRRILALGDSHWRDAPGLALLKHELDRDEDLEPWIAPFDIAFQAVEALQPHVLLLNHVMGKRNRKLANYVMRRGGESVVLPTENRGNTTDEIEWYARQVDSSYCDLFLGWSEETARQIHPPVNVVGCPRFDVYRYPGLAKDREIFNTQHGLDPEKKTVLFASAFPQGKFAYSNQVFHEHDRKDIGSVEREGREDPVEFARKEYERLQQFAFWVESVAQEKTWNVIVKPHPLEDLSFWQKRDVPLIRGGYIHDAVSCCDVLVAKAGCMTHMDAWLGSVPSIHCTIGEEAKDGPGREAMDYGAVATHPIELLDHLHSWRYGNLSLDGTEREYLRKYGFLTDEPASVQAAHVISDIARDVEIKHEPDYITLSKLLKQHQSTIAEVDGLGHYRKSITRKIAYEWGQRVARCVS